MPETPIQDTLRSAGSPGTPQNPRLGSFRAGVTIYVPDTNALLSALGG